MDVEADALLLEIVHQFGGQARQIHPQALHPVIQIRIHHFDHGVAAAVVDVHGGDPACLHVVEEAAVTHAGHGGVARSRCGCVGAEVAAAQHLQPEECDHRQGQEPESQNTPALIHS